MTEAKHTPGPWKGLLEVAKAVVETFGTESYVLSELAKAIAKVEGRE